jgi:hypothetical protein
MVFIPLLKSSIPTPVEIPASGENKKMLGFFYPG